MNEIKNEFFNFFMKRKLDFFLPVNFYSAEVSESNNEDIVKETSFFHNNQEYKCGISPKPISKNIDYNNFTHGN